MSEIVDRKGILGCLDQVFFFGFFPLHSIVFSISAYLTLLIRGGLKTRGALLLYTAYIISDRSPDRGGWMWTWRLGLTQLFRNCAVWRFSAAGRGPIKLEQTVALPAEEGPYIFTNHPHGIIGVAPMTHFGTNVTCLEELFPKLQVHLLGASAFFRIPFFREWALLHGHSSVGRTSCMALLHSGHSIALAPGGARESLESTPGTMRLILKRRRGFVKLALATGAALVPVLSFGENELYNTFQFEPGTCGRWCQGLLQRVFGFTVPLFIGRGWLLPFLPSRSPVYTVVGPAVRPDKACIDLADEEAVDSLHTKYCEALCKLFDRHKAAHGLGDVQLQLA